MPFAESGQAEAVRLPIGLIDPNPRNPRRELLDVNALAENIRTFGLLQPLTVRRVGDRYELLGGHRRLAAFQVLGEREPHEPSWRAVPAVVRDSEDDQRDFLRLLSGQVHSRNFTPREEAAALESLIGRGLTLKQIGESLNRTESWASKRLRVYADAVLSGYVQADKLAPAVAEELLVIADAHRRRQFADKAVEHSWSQSDARREVRKLTLDKQVREVGRRARDLLEVLSSTDVRSLPTATTRDLWALHARIEMLARGGPIIPTIEEAQRAAGIGPEPRARRSVARPARKRPQRESTTTSSLQRSS